MESTQSFIAVGKPSAFKRVVVILLVTAVLLTGALYAAGYILIKGPSAYAGQMFVRSVHDQPVMSLVLKLYLSDAEINAIVSSVANDAADSGDGAGQLFSVYPHGSKEAE